MSSQYETSRLKVLKMIAREMSLGLLLLGMFYTTIACGKTYQCRNSNGQLMIADTPCPVGSKTEKVRIFHPPSPVTPQSKDGSASDTSSVYQRNLRYLDIKIDEAISARDFSLARQLALTPEHWKKIDDAGKNSVPQIVKPGVDLKQQPQISVEQITQQVTQPQVISQQVMQQQATQQQQLQQLQQQEVQRQQQKQQEFQQLQQQEAQRQQQRQLELQQIQQQVLQQQQQKQQQVQQQRQVCLNRLQNRPQNQPAATAYAIRQAGSSAASVQALLAQNFARDAALCNSIQ